MLHFTCTGSIKLSEILCPQQPCRMCLMRPSDYRLRGILKETPRGEKILEFCCRSRFESSLMWFILPPVQPSSLATPRQHLGCVPHKRQMCSHGNRPVMPLLVCQIKSTSTERNQLVTRLISHQYDGVTSESQAAVWPCERRLSLLDTRTSQNLLLSLFLPWPFFSFISVCSSSGRSFMNVHRSWMTAPYWCCRGEILFPAKDSRTINRN